MAEEEFLNLDDEEFLEEDLAEVPHEIEERLDKEQNSKLLYIIIILLMIAVIIVSGIFFYLYTQKQKRPVPEVNATKIVEKVIEKEAPKKEENTQVQKWLKEAQRLFASGEKEKALALYQKIARYNKALSYFNIGVAHLKEGNYTAAIKSFDKASFDQNFKCESALNSAVCAFNLKDPDQFKHYLQQAKEYLIYKRESPLFSYYNSLINYYQNAYPETLVSIKHPTSDHYRRKEFFIGSKIYTSFESLQNAIDMLERADSAKNFFTLGLLYANTGKYEIASDYLQKAIDINDHVVEAKVARALAQNRLGNLQTAADLLEDAQKADANATEIYPIKVALKKSLFDPIAAQERFQKNLLLDKFYKFSLLFYYAPYKLSLYDNAQTGIQKGAKSIDIDKTKSAMAYLSTSKNIAQVNLEIARAIEFSLAHRLYETVAIFKDAIKKYPWDAVLHYNLGLAYTQMFNFKDAYTEFAKSQTLDSALFEAAIFKSYCAHLINRDPTIENLEQIYALLSIQKDEAYKRRISALINIAKDTLSLPYGYLPADVHPFDTAIDMIFAYNRSEEKTYRESTEALKKLLPKDLVANIVYIDAHYDKNDIKNYAKVIQQNLIQRNLDFRPLYYGETLPRELYIRMLNIAGVVHKLLDRLKEDEPKAGKYIAFMQTKALALIYTRRFEEAYRTYNTLIDSCMQNDSHTLFLASVAAIGANHPANAIALLELSKLTDTSNMESRYALGLLYQEAKNFEGAAIQYRKIGNSGFISDYFTFFIDQQ
jgi:tetratricopeptide (TPR) repeat protein